MIENQPPLNMCRYIAATGSDKHWCMTSCCVAGYGMINGISIPPQIQSDVDIIKQNTFGHYDLIRLGEAYAYNLLGTPPNVNNDIQLLLFDSFEFLFGARNSNNITHAIDRLNFMIDHQTPPLMCRTITKDTENGENMRGLEYTTTSVKQFLERFPQLIPTVVNDPSTELDLFNVHYHYVGVVDMMDDTAPFGIVDDSELIYTTEHHSTAYAFSDKSIIDEIKSFIDNVEWTFQPQLRD